MRCAPELLFFHPFSHIPPVRPHPSSHPLFWEGGRIINVESLPSSGSREWGRAGGCAGEPGLLPPMGDRGGATPAAERLCRGVGAPPSAEYRDSAPLGCWRVSEQAAGGGWDLPGVAGY